MRMSIFKSCFIVLAATITLGIVNYSPVIALSGGDFKAGRIIDDAVFYSDKAMTAAQIQDFLNAKVPTCDTWGQQMYNSTQTRAQYGASKGYPAPYSCLKEYRQDTGYKAGQSGLCSAIEAKVNRTAAQIIDDVARACHISQKVIVVMLQKEQGLVTDDWPWSLQYRGAMGYGCPDTAACDSEYYGFFNQVYNAALQFQRYKADPANWNHVPFMTNNVLYQANAPSCGSRSTYIENYATAGLYNYTPYTPNSAALDNLYGTGDSCSAYGNRNFWRYYNDWFGSTFNQVSYVQMQGSSAQYIVYDGKKQALTYDGLLAWGIDRLPLTTLSATTLGAMPTVSTPLTRVSQIEGTASQVFVDNAIYYDITSNIRQTWGNFNATQTSVIPWKVLDLVGYGGLLPTVVNQSGGQYLMEAGTIRQFTTPTVLRLWAGTSPASISLSSQYGNTIPVGAVINHNLGSVSGAYYLVDQTKAYSITAKVASLLPEWQPVPISSSSLARYSNKGALSHLVKSPSQTTIFALDKGQRRAISTFQIFNFLRPTSAAETTLSNDAVSLLPTNNDSIDSSILRNESTGSYSAIYRSARPIDARLTSEYDAPTTSETMSSAFINIFTQTTPATQFIKKESAAGIYFANQGTKIGITRLDVMELLSYGSSPTVISDNDFNRIPTTTSGPMKPILSSPSGSLMVIDGPRAYETTPDLTAITSSWKISTSTSVSQETFDWFSNNRTVSALDQHIQAPNGEFCFVDTAGRLCAEQAHMISIWKLPYNHIKPSSRLLGYLGIERKGALRMFVAATSGQEAGKVYAMVDGSLYYIPNPALLSNLGFNGTTTTLSSESIVRAKAPGAIAKYLLKDPSESLWVIDNGKKRSVPGSLVANWSSQTITPLDVSSSYLSAFPSSTSISRSVTSSSTGTIFGMDAGQKRAISTYQKYTESWSPYVNISPNLLELIPSGNDI